MNLLKHRRFPLVCVILALLVALPTLAAGFYLDDYVHIAFLEKKAQWNPAWWDLYRFTPENRDQLEALVAKGMFPWWTIPTLEIHFFRPLTCAIFALDHALFAHQPLGYHLHSLVWWLALVVAVALLFREILPGALGHLALLVFALDDAHVLPIAWIASRHMLVASVFALFGFVAHVRFRERGFQAGRWLGPAGLVLGLLSSEAALGIAAYWVAYELVGRSPRATWREKSLQSLPVLLIVGAYVVLYRAIGCGVHDSGNYIDPGADPVRFASAAMERISILTADALMGIPSDWADALPLMTFLVPAVLGGAMLILLLRAIWPRIDEPQRRTLSWMAVGTGLSLIVGLGGIPGSRLLLAPSIGVAALIAAVLLHGFARVASGSGGLGLWLRRLGAGTFVLVHIVLAPLKLVALENLVGTMVRGTKHMALTAEASPQTKRFIVLASSDPVASFYPPFVRMVENGARDENWFTLSIAKGQHHVTRTGPSSFRLEVDAPTMLSSVLERVFRRADQPYRQGDVVRLDGMNITIGSVTAGAPTSLEVSLENSLDDPSTALLTLDGGTLRRLTLPVGERRTLPFP